MNVKLRLHFSYPMYSSLPFNLSGTFDLSHHMIHLPVLQAYFFFPSISRNNFYYSVFFFLFIFTKILSYRHDDALHPENFLTLTFFILMESKPDSYYVRTIWYSRKDT